MSKMINPLIYQNRLFLFKKMNYKHQPKIKKNSWELPKLILNAKKI